MNIEVIYGILIPFAGTTLGAAGVFFMKKELSDLVQRALTGFAAGVMVAASVWSLLIPAMEQSESLGRLAFLPAAVGFWIGILFLLVLDHIIPHRGDYPLWKDPDNLQSLCATHHNGTKQREELRGHPLVSSFKPGENNEGGEGVTVVKLAQR